MTKVYRPSTNDLIRGYTPSHPGYDFSGVNDVETNFSDYAYACRSGKIITRVDRYVNSWRNTGRLTNRDFGNYLKILHDDGSFSICAHLQKGSLASGAVVTGQRIAKIGNTGNSTGRHLHFQYHNKEGKAIKVEFTENIMSEDIDQDLKKIYDHYGVKSVEELLHKVDGDFKHLENARKTIPDLRTKIQKHETEITRLREELRKAEEDRKRETGACSDEVKLYKDFVARLAEALGVGHKTEAVEAEIGRLVNLEDDLRKEREAHSKTTEKLTEANQELSKLYDEASDCIGARLASVNTVLRAFKRLYMTNASLSIKKKEPIMGKVSPKKWYKSKTVWLAILQAFSGILAAVMLELPSVGMIVAGKSVIDMALRFVTDSKIK